jgi:thiosulfate sulfurtransferase
MTTFKRIDAHTAYQLRQQGACVVDIRDPHSFASAHITGSQHLDNQSIHDFLCDTDRNTQVVVTCYHGNSSQNAAAYLAHQGFTDVYSLDGGIEAWKQCYPDELSQQQ